MARRYYPYVIAKRPESGTSIDMKDVIKIGYTYNPTIRWKDLIRSWELDETKYGMILIMECNAKNLPDGIFTPHMFGITVEHALGTLFECYRGFRPSSFKAGNSTNDDPYYKLFAKESNLVSVIKPLLYKALRLGIFVSKNVSF